MKKTYGKLRNNNLPLVLTRHVIDGKVINVRCNISKRERERDGE